MEDLYANLTRLLKNPEEYLRPDSKLQEAWAEQTRELYNFTKQEEERYQLPSPDDALPSLEDTSGLDPEQMWQVVELQNKALLAAPDDVRTLGDINLCLGVATLTSLAKLGKLTTDFTGHDEGIGASADEDEDMKEESEEEAMDEDENYEAENEEEEECEAENEEEEEYEAENEDEEEVEEEEEEEEEGEEEDLCKKPEGLDDMELNDNFDNDSDDSEDNFDQLVAREGYEDSDSEADDKPDPSSRHKQTEKTEKQTEKQSEDDEDSDHPIERESNNKRSNVTQQEFKKTRVDTKFFKLRESEWVADNDAIGENFQADSEDDIDLMADMSDGSAGEETAMYDAFFDEPTGGKEKEKKRLSEMLAKGDNDDDDEEEEEDEEADDDGSEREKSGMKEEEEVQGTLLLGAPKKEKKSRFEMEREKELAVMGQLETDNVGERPWYLRGEAQVVDRPEDSALQQRLDYDIAVRQKPLQTEDTSTLVEKIILGRVRSAAWDDVERKVKPTLDPAHFKKKLLLDQDKSKKSLAQIYEEEYVKQQEARKEGEEDEELPEHEDIRQRMDKLFTKLDALSNFHYTPSMPKAEVKIKSNLPAITLEEATPDTATSATLLAPQEIHEPGRGELIGTTERTDTDRKRERRGKKNKQRQRAQHADRKLADKLKKAGGAGKLDQQATTRIIQKAVKAGHVKMLDGGQDKSVKSSKTFFKTLQDNTGKKVKDGTKTKAKTKEVRKSQSMTKLML